jgi:glutathione S-transferase
LRVPAIIDTAKWEFARATAVLTQGLGDREFIVGDSFTVADILLSNTLNWARHRNIEITQPALNAYADRNLSRPALHRALDREKTSG